MPSPGTMLLCRNEDVAHWERGVFPDSHSSWGLSISLRAGPEGFRKHLLPAPRPPYQPLELSYDFEEVAGGEARRSLVILIKLPMKSGVFSCAVRCTWLAVRGH